MTTSAWSEEGGALLTDRSAVSSVATTATTATQKSSALAASVYDGVKSKMRDLRAQLAHKEQLVAQLHHQLEAAAAQAESAAAAATAHEVEVVSEVRVEAERQQARHLAFIDRLLADKDALTQKCSALAYDMASVEER
jgi:5-azacytidine-induced protein 1